MAVLVSQNAIDGQLLRASMAQRSRTIASKRYVVVLEAAIVLRRRCRRAGSGWRTRRPPLLLTRAVIAALATSAAFALTTQHLHLVGDDIGGVALDAILVGVLVGPQRTFDIHLPALLQVLASDFREAAEEFDPVPFGAFLALTGLLVLPA